MRKCWLFTLGLLWILAACQPAPPELTPQEIVAQAAINMEALQGFRFTIDRSGAPAYLDATNTLSLRRAEGEYAAPDRARATVRVILPGLVTNIAVVSVGENQWQTNPLTGRWEQLPPDWGFNPAILFREDIGLPAILAADLTNTTLDAPEKLEGGPNVALHKVTGDVVGDRLYDLSGGLIGPEPVQVTLWIEPERFLLHRILVIEPVPGSEEPSVWQVDFSQFGETFVIEPPVP